MEVCHTPAQWLTRSLEALEALELSQRDESNQ